MKIQIFPSPGHKDFAVLVLEFRCTVVGEKPLNVSSSSTWRSAPGNLDSIPGQSRVLHASAGGMGRGKGAVDKVLAQTAASRACNNDCSRSR